MRYKVQTREVDGVVTPDVDSAYRVVEDHGDGTVTVEVQEGEAGREALRRAARIATQDRVRAADLSDDDVAALSILYDPWRPGEDVGVGDLRSWDGTIVECIQAHRTQSDWTPGETPALWKVHRQAVPDGEAPPEWKQPDSTNGYRQGERVTFEGQVYESTHDGANVWSPTAYPQGWKLIE